MYFHRAISFLALTLILAACGTIATPVPSSQPTAAVVAQAEPTMTVAPPTATQPEPSATATALPSVTPTVAPTEPAAVDQVTTLVDLTGSVANGEVLFTTFHEAAGFACSTCHLVDTEDQLIGPGLLNVGQRAASRVEGQSAAQYIFNSIHEPNAYVVDGFAPDIMPDNFNEILSDQDTYDIIAYLLTLEGGAAVTESTTNSEIANNGTLPDFDAYTPDVANGEALFGTFQADAGFACSTCHLVDTENQLIGPGLLNVGQRAATRVQEQDAQAYLYTSIVNPDAFVVPDNTDDLMPENWAEIYSDEQIMDIIAYLQTLEG
jgi:cytochrome c2